MTDLLLDTQVALWFLRGDERASHALGVDFDDASSTVTLSTASIVEIAIKHSIGKLRERCDDVRAALLSNGVLELSITANHASALESLPYRHRDPIDRLLIAQAQAEELTLVTADRDIARYDDLVTIRLL